MKVPRNHKRYILLMMLQALLIVVIEILAIYIAWIYSNWIFFICGIVVCLLLALLLAKYYYSGAFFKCSICETTFKPSQKEFMKNVNIKRGRVFTCPTCAKKVKCKEGFIYGATFR